MTVERTVLVNEPVSVTKLAEVVNQAGRFRSEIRFVKHDKAVDAKSILGVLALSISPGNAITIGAEGADANDAVAALESILSVARSVAS